MLNHMEYLDGMENIGSEIQGKVISAMNEYIPENYTDKDVINALESDVCTVENYKALLSPSAEKFLEEIAHKARYE